MTNLTEDAATFGAKASEVGERAADLMRTAGQKLQEARNDTAGGLHAAAASVRNTGRQGSEAIDSLANGAADKLDATAAYVENYDPRNVLNGFRGMIRRRPVRALAVAATIGLFAGCVITQVSNLCMKKA